jgi:hypothetical protein
MRQRCNLTVKGFSVIVSSLKPKQGTSIELPGYRKPFEVVTGRREPQGQPAVFTGGKYAQVLRIEQAEAI